MTSSSPQNTQAILSHPKDLSQKQKDLSIQLNRLRAQKAVLEHRLKTGAKKERKARTRTLIQMGALLTLTPLPDLLGIAEGENLQGDIDSIDKAAILLGMLLSVSDNLPPCPPPSVLESFKKIGLRTLKMQTRDTYLKS